MAFDPENPVKPQDLYATFDLNNTLTGLIYKSPDEGTYTRINGEWQPLSSRTNPFGMGAHVVFVDPSFIMEYDARTMYREYISKEEVSKEFGVEPNFGLNP